ncbi:hypothetical protein VOLCADRAFT_92253 [Volvox carteri f. nagariensis]|uniref:Uncharacterized protein n=1 Tax=Volvox carteri f. nagariensis TaxID=3068 RepID=D8TZ62_VOLCA|nr:uncharacterized protein VOLCADRAFT_92253 [Volvox carteri f. nagariensis]EFJ47221.1 hypothetical protein VOLCADRAFT_92253 [Volvox carteri f. nagariensis]|eukprot:XP_002951770.1 hypothetical protein VOLCADRAFT_92253 [Volvox carteri f. nagariensis]
MLKDKCVKLRRLLLFLAVALYSAHSTAGARSAGANSALRRPHGQFRYTSVLPERAPCVILERRYVSSPLEQKWVKAAAKWKQDGNGDLGDVNPYCDFLTETMPDIQRMLTRVETLMSSNTTLSDAPDADDVLSYFNITIQCGPFRVTRKEHIESLVGPLRHPFSIKCPAQFTQLPPPTNIFDKSYMLLASRKGQGQVARNKYYLDAGAGIGYLANSNQYWMVQSYEQRGLKLDRAIFWEASQSDGMTVLRDVPSEMFPAFTFYNIPAPQDLNDGRNPLNVVTKLAKPEDFVSIKLDIDQPDIEDSWLRAILDGGPTGQSRSRYAQLIDELFWEHHFNFMPMQSCCWQSLVDMQSQLVDSMNLFIRLRELGIRSHYWQ